MGKILLIVLLMAIIIGLIFVDGSKAGDDGQAVSETPKENVTERKSETPPESAKEEPTVDNSVKTAKVMASGDMLYHIPVYQSAYNQATGTYDFHPNYEFIKPLVSSADLALGDFEGTISPDFPLSGYPMFNAPPEVVAAIKDAGYDAITLAHNHVLDSHLVGLLSTAKAFRDAGLDVFGVSTGDEDILVKEVNGIRIALLGYAYGFNGMEGLLTQEEYDAHLKDLNPELVRREIERAEEIADVTIVMPQLGVEYDLQPNDEQIQMYHQMIEWGADVIFANHPHVVQPTEIVQKDGYDKFILYSMGNLISNQRLETVEDIWTERGTITEVNLKKTGDGPVILESVVPHITWVNKTATGGYNVDGTPQYLYQTYIAKDFIVGGKHADLVDETTRARITSAYEETLKHLNLQPLNGLKE